MIFQIKNFTYNGFMGQLKAGYTKYTAKFVTWTNDPGIAVFECSDGKERLIPTFALEGDYSVLPEQDISNKVLFGLPSKS